MNEFDPKKINEYRNIHESSTEWKLREAFLMAHYTKLSEERLVCLASCFVNVECYGCRYPPMVMEQLKELMEEIQETLDEHRNMTREKLKVKFVKATVSDEMETGLTASKIGMGMKFVKASENFGSLSKPSEIKGSDETDKGNSGQRGTLESDFAAFPRQLKTKRADAPISYEFKKDCEKNVCVLPSPKLVNEMLDKNRKISKLNFDKMTLPEEEESDQSKFHMLSSYVKKISGLQKNAIETLHQAADKCQMGIVCDFNTAHAHQFTCEVLVNHVYLAKGVAPSKKQAKHIAYEKAVSALMRPHTNIIFSHKKNKELLSSESGCNELKCPSPVTEPQLLPHLGGSTESKCQSLYRGKKRGYPDQPKPLSEFIIFQPKPDEAAIENSVNILRMSADFNHTLLDYDFREEAVIGGTTHVKCHLLLQHSLLATAEGISKTSAKAIVSQKALQKLRQTQWTIQIRNHQDTDKTCISREEVLGDMEVQCQAIPSHNIGNKLLQKMGWVGGGIGKDGSGIAVPVSVDSVMDRQGLGLSAEQGASKDFVLKVRNVISNYVKSNNQSDFALSADFSKEERAVLHKEAQKLGLKTKSYGTGVNRYLVISRRRSPNELFEHVMKSGGTTSKYQLLAPQNLRQ